MSACRIGDPVCVAPTGDMCGEGSVWHASQTEIAYDNMGRLMGTTTTYSFLPGHNFQNAYTYDAASNRTSLTVPDTSITTYGYDTLNRLSGLANSWAGSFGFGYDALSRRTQLTRPNGITTNYNYDSLSHLLSVLHQAGTNILDGASYTYDLAGNRTSKGNYLNGVTSNYAYDPLYQLTQVTQAGSTTETYSYDLVGNRLSSSGVPSYSYNSSNELTSNSNGSYTYDANGNTLSDPSGKQYTWDFENRLTQAVVTGTGGGTTTFKYDPFGRRIQKISPNFTSTFVYDDDNLLETVNASGSEVAGYTQGLGLDELLAMERGSAVDYYEADALGSVTSLTTSTGSISQNYGYDSFGNLSSSTGTIRNYFQFAGRELDTETSLYYFRHRYYDPSIGRFLSEDPNDQGSLYDPLNLYLYVENHPVDWVDPLGLYTLKKGGPHPPLPPSPEIDALLKCIEAKTGLHLLVTSTSEDIPQHLPGTPHRRGVAVDVAYVPGTANQILCAAKECGAGFGLDEAAHPSAKSTGKHVHVQIPPGKRGGHGDLPNGPCSRCGN